MATNGGSAGMRTDRSHGPPRFATAPPDRSGGCESLVSRFWIFSRNGRSGTWADPLIWRSTSVDVPPLTFMWTSVWTLGS